MKKTIVVIFLIAIAVLFSLLTISAISNRGYSVTPCDAIDISLENATVTDFLNATNMTTVHVYNFKGYKGKNTWMVQWSSSNRSLDVYVNVATGNIVGIAGQTDVSPTPTPEPTPTPITTHSAVVLAGEVVGKEGSTDQTIGTLYIPLKIGAGSGAIQIGTGNTDSNLTVTYCDEKVYEDACTWSAIFTEARNYNGYLDYGEKVQLNVTVPTGAVLLTPSTAADATFQIEIKPVEGEALSMAKQTPSYIEKYNILY